MIYMPFTTVCNILQISSDDHFETSANPNKTPLWSTFQPSSQSAYSTTLTYYYSTFLPTICATPFLPKEQALQ